KSDSPGRQSTASTSNRSFPPRSSHAICSDISLATQYSSTYPVPRSAHHPFSDASLSHPHSPASLMTTAQDFHPCSESERTSLRGCRPTESKTSPNPPHSVQAPLCPIRGRTTMCHSQESSRHSRANSPASPCA